MSNASPPLPAAAETPSPKPRPPRLYSWRAVVIVLFMAALFAIGWHGVHHPHMHHLHPHRPHMPHVDRKLLASWLKPLGPWAPVGFVVFFTLAVLIAFPTSAMTLAGGAMFGFGMGLLLNAIGALTGAVLGFYVSRVLGRNVVERWLKDSLARFDASVEQSGFGTLFAMRLSSVFPYAVLNYAAGVSRISFRRYFLATLLGFLPGEIIYTYLGASLVTFEPWPIALGLALLGALSFGTVYWKRKRSLTQPKPVDAPAGSLSTLVERENELTPGQRD